jgi:hypothetical protein
MVAQFQTMYGVIDMDRNPLQFHRCSRITGKGIQFQYCLLSDVGGRPPSSQYPDSFPKDEDGREGPGDSERDKGGRQK